MAIKLLITLKRPREFTPHIATDWQVATDDQFNNIIDSNLNDTVNLLTYFKEYSVTSDIYIRVRFRFTNYTSDWSDITTLAGSAYLVVGVPSISINNEPSEIRKNPTITISDYNVIEGDDTHISTDWVLMNEDRTEIIWESLNDTVNLTEISIPLGYLWNEVTYHVLVVQNGVGASVQNSKEFTVEGRLENIWEFITLNYHPAHADSGAFTSMGFSKYGDNQVFITGGFYSHIYDECFVYDLNLDAIITKAPLPKSLKQHAQVSLPNDKIMVMLGITFNSTTGQNEVSSSCFIYDKTLDSWTQVADAPIYSNGDAIAVLYDTDTVYLFDNDSGNNYIHIYEYTISTDTWQTLTTNNNMYQPPKDVIVDDNQDVFLFGANPYTEIYKLNKVTMEWDVYDAFVINSIYKTIELNNERYFSFTTPSTTIYYNHLSMETISAGRLDYSINLRDNPYILTDRSDVIFLEPGNCIKYTSDL